MLHVRIVWVVNLLFSLTHLSEGLAVRSRAENDVFILRLHVSCSELVCAEVSVFVLGLAEECSQVSILSGLLNDFKLLGLGLVLEAALSAIESCLVVLMAALLLHVLLHEDLRNRLHDRRLSTLVELMTLLALNLFNDCLCLVRSLKVRVTRIIHIRFLIL